jgi:hypothetical protein
MSVVEELRELRRKRPMQLIVLAGLLAWLTWFSCSLKWSVLDPDVWWHLKAGDWIVQHHSVPHTGLFSYTAADRRWLDYSWSYEILLSCAYSWFGLVGIATLGVLLTVAVAWTVYWTLRRLSGHFWLACVLTVATCCAFLFDVTPRAVFFSIGLFAVVLTLILEANRTGRVCLLYYLPPIFVLWANLHIQFIYGLFLVGLLAGISIVQEACVALGIASPACSPRLQARKLMLIFAACFSATCIGPYSFHLYSVIYGYLGASFPYRVIHEFQPIDFRSPGHYMQLLLAGAGFFSLGLSKKMDPYKLALLTVASVVGFRAIRDSWFICIPAAACIADAFSEKTPSRYSGDTRTEMTGLAVVFALSLLLVARNTDFNQRGLAQVVRSQFPADAVRYLREHPQRGPLYNPLDWGGYLIWASPEYPVAIDGRYDVYGEDLSWRFYRTQMSPRSSLPDSYLDRAGVVLLQEESPLASYLTSDSRFVRVYQDPMAVILVRR